MTILPAKKALAAMGAVFFLPGAVLAGLVGWVNLPAGLLFLAAWLGLTALARLRLGSLRADAAPGGLTVRWGLAFPRLVRLPVNRQLRLSRTALPGMGLLVRVSAPCGSALLWAVTEQDWAALTALALGA